MMDAKNAVLAAVGHYRGWPAGESPPLDGIDPGPFGTIARVCATVWLAETGRRDQAMAIYRRLGPARGWAMPAFLRLPVIAYGILAAAGLDDDQSLADLYEILLREPGRHVANAAGAVSYLGPVDLFCGIAAARLGRLDAAVSHLEDALAIARACSAPAAAVEASVELAKARLTRRTGDDAAVGQHVAVWALSEARRLGMAPFAERSERCIAATERIPASPVTARELDVARLVAKGLTNRQIAEALVISDRTARNHVQHTLTKLGFSTRAQIAAWATAQELE